MIINHAPIGPIEAIWPSTGLCGQRAVEVTTEELHSLTVRRESVGGVLHVIERAAQPNCADCHDIQAEQAAKEHIS